MINDDEIINVQKPENVEADIMESMAINDLYHEAEAESFLILEEFKINETAKNSEKSKNFSASRKLPKIELPIFNGDPLHWQRFWNQFNI